ncbi:hypothetical protein C5167_019519 [Papaver somniferum]|uniref:Uncharacterized protein n=1 Tax=Papaver somniferum TaxID=3469 RepID=A0A4Y7ISH1_PAPSO|nr:hypothetical protein C5167_019519 [Papaver somniferum]
MRSQPLSVNKAIETFQTARPPGIYKQDYIDALYAFYHETKPEDASCPNTPEWKRSSDLNGESMRDDEDDGGGIITRSQDNQVPTEVLTNDDVLGDAIPWDQQEAMREFCNYNLKLGAGAKGTAQFPGSHRFTQQGKLTIVEAEVLLCYMESRWYTIYDAYNF